MSKDLTVAEREVFNVCKQINSLINNEKYLGCRPRRRKW